MPLERSAGAVIFHQKKDAPEYLLLHYTARHWDLPKGHIENGEKQKEAAKREVKEETGLEDIEFSPGFEETIKYFYKREGRNFFKVVVFFLAEAKTKKVKISYEHQGFKWLPYEKALKQLTFKNAKEIIKKANNFLSRKGLSGGKKNT